MEEMVRLMQDRARRKASLAWVDRCLTYLSLRAEHHIVKQNAVRTSIDLPRDLHRRLHEAAARKGCSARKLILAGIERTVQETKAARPKRRLDLNKPLIRPGGRRITLTNEEAYELIELPALTS